MARRSRKIEASVRQTVFYVAMEGSVTERKYFDALIRKYNIRNVILLKKSKTRSSPQDVLKRLEQQMTSRKNDHGVILDERFWAVFDTDKRPIEMLNKVATKAAKKNIQIAASNPCFELWLLLHYGARNRFRGVEGSAATGGCDKVIEYLKRNFDKNYHKSAFNPSEYIQKINEAISNAKASDSDDEDAWLNQIGSRVYKLAESIINSAASPNNPLN